MSSPFPGMDPFLEHPRLFPGLHSRLIGNMSDFLQARLPEPYYAEIGEVLWVETAGRAFEPDVDVFRREPTSAPAPSGLTVAAPAQRTAPIVIHIPQVERRHTFVEIRNLVEGGDRLVTAIEILSPSNKTPGQKARKQYLRKQREILEGDINLVEIDLLRRGRHTTAVLLEDAGAKAGPFDYHVCIHQYDKPEDYFVYPILLRDRLPEIAIPLLAEDAPVLVDLQAVFDRVYDAGPYRRRVRYAEETPVPPLTPEQAEWAAQVLREKGLITARQ